MNNLKFTVGKGTTIYDYSELVSKVVWTGRKGAAPRNISVTLLNSEGYAMERASVNVENGQTCVLYEDGKELFRGLLMTESRTEKRTLTVKAYDNLIYLCNSKDSFSYKEKRADQIFKDCCKKAGVSVGSAVNTGHSISELTKTSATYWDMIEEALEETYYSTGKRFYVTSVKGKVYLKQRSTPDSMLKLEDTVNTESYTDARSIYDTRTRITLTTSENTVKKSWVNTALEKKIGRFAEVQSVNKDATATELQQKIKTFKKEKGLVSHTLTWTGTGDNSVISGGCVYVVNKLLGVKRVMYVDEDTHTYENGRHQMKLKLNYVPDWDEEKKTSSDGSSSSETGKYKVNAKSGLNVRTSPNSTIIATMPYGTVVTSDGKTNGGWLHIKYNGTWGYAYQIYLTEQ